MVRCGRAAPADVDLVIGFRIQPAVANLSKQIPDQIVISDPAGAIRFIHGDRPRCRSWL